MGVQDIMLKKLKKFHDKHRGFTLIELILVISILAIIAGISVPKFSDFIQRSRIAADQATVATLNKATELFRTNTLSADPFLDESKTADYLLNQLVGTNYLSAPIKVQSKGAFQWFVGKERWELIAKNAVHVISLSDGLEIVGDGQIKRKTNGTYEGQSQEIMVPASIDGKEIRSLGQDTFNGVNLTSVTFAPDSKVNRIHARAFQNSNLSNIDFPATLTTIDTSAFYNNQLTTINLPPNLTAMESHAFKNNKLTTINFPDTLDKIPQFAFKNNKLTKIKLPANLKTIGQKAFDGNELTEITIGQHVSGFGEKVFGANTKDFKAAYDNGKAGTYKLSGENWIRQ